jgi:hypothetical protein
MTYRVGTHYDIHVYAGDRPVATFHDPSEAARFVQTMNEAEFTPEPAPLTGIEMAWGRLADELASRIVEAEATIARVRALGDEWDRLPHGVVIDVREEVTGLLRAALDPSVETPTGVEMAWRSGSWLSEDSPADLVVKKDL